MLKALHSKKGAVIHADLLEMVLGSAVPQKPSWALPWLPLSEPGREHAAGKQNGTPVLEIMTYPV